MSIGPFGDGTFGTSVFSSSPLYTTKTLIDAVLNDTGHTSYSTETGKRAVALSFLNNRYAWISSLQHWDWLFQAYDFNFNAPYETGTISLTAGSQTVTGASTLWSANILPNNLLVPGNRAETYLISTVTSNTILTLEGQYAGDTAAAQTYKIIKPIYTLPGDCEHIQSITLDGFGKLVPLSRQEFALQKQYTPHLTGTPRYYTEIARRSQDGVRLIEVFPSPDQAYIVQLNYGVNIQKLADTETSYPLIPDRYRMVLYYGALAEMYRYLRDASNALTAEEHFKQTLSNMRNDKQLTDSRVRFVPARHYKNRSRRSSSRSWDIIDFKRGE